MPLYGDSSFGTGCSHRTTNMAVLRVAARTMVALAVVRPAAAALAAVSVALAEAADSAAAVAVEDGSSLSATASYPRWGGRMRFSSGMPLACHLL